MQHTDIFSQVRSQKTQQYIAIGTLSLVLAIGVNAFIFTTNTGIQMQAAVLGAVSPSGEIPDISIVENGTGSDMIALKINKKMENVRELRFSVITDAEKLKIVDVFSEIRGAEVLTSSQIPGITLINLRFDAPQTLLASTQPLSIVYKKSTSEDIPLTLAEAQFVTSDKSVYDLTNEAVKIR